MKRREFLTSAGALIVSPAIHSTLLGTAAAASAKPPATAADYTLKIEPCTIEISPGVNVETIGYNGQVPGPVLRMREGSPVTIDVTNASKTPEIVHWHGLKIDSLNDGAMEEGSPMIPAGASLRYHFTPRPSGTRWYHTHTSAGADLSKATYTGQFGFLVVDGADDPGHYDQEVFLAIHHWSPSFVPMLQTMQMQSANNPCLNRFGCRVSIRHSESTSVGLWRAHSRKAGAEGVDAPAECQRHRECGAFAARPSIQSRGHGRQSGSHSERG